VKNLIIQLSNLCFAIKTTKSSVNKNSVKTMHFAYLHSFLKYGILFWENSRNPKKMFKLQQNSKRLIANISSTTKLQTIIQIIKDYDTILHVYVCVCVCVYVYIYIYIYIYEILYILKYIQVDSKLILCFIHMIQRISHIYYESNTKLLEHSTIYKGMLIYNKLSNKIKSFKCIMKFKEILINFLL
jgi:hypothetical protein